LACGIPVVTVAVRDAEMFDGVSAGVRVANDDPNDLATALQQVLRVTVPDRKSLLPHGLTLPDSATALTRLYADVSRRPSEPESR